MAIIKEIRTNIACYKVGVGGVTKIKDSTIEYENSIDFLFDIYNNQKLIAQLINLRAVIIFK